MDPLMPKNDAGRSGSNTNIESDYSGGLAVLSVLVAASSMQQRRSSIVDALVYQGRWIRMLSSASTAQTGSLAKRRWHRIGHHVQLAVHGRW